MADRVRRPDHLHLTQLRLNRTELTTIDGATSLVRTWGIRPQPGQDRSAGSIRDHTRVNLLYHADQKQQPNENRQSPVTTTQGFSGRSSQ